ncbi:hypothetical protein BU23DRAFT_585009 [Bimuria novae-zelandiae CBS 107.79]|uniref:Uncharacterized protein n=1 Tax=Bimuria novae-zelandiae CBS 107.79 TaxID=1447943 RepID=A0A6A5URE6_9PLEO|nr:hypothetical protein BU23DRAFT_585009 [Bimuria novae-zelandiae CBS 107.79]
MLSHGCALSPSAAAFSSMLSAFIGSMLNGLFSGLWIAFFTGWISWFSVARIVAAGLYEFYLIIKIGTDFDSAGAQQFQSIGLHMYGGSNAGAGSAPSEVVDEEARLMQAMNHAQQNLETHYHPVVVAQFKKNRTDRYFRAVFKELERTVSAFGWLGWVWSAVYTPLSQSIFLAVHITSDRDSILLFVRALAIGVSALGLTFDYKQRYGAALGRKWGPWAFVVFNVWTSTTCLLLGYEALALLIRGIMNFSNPPIPLLLVYPIFSCIWACVSWKVLPPIDGARPGLNLLADVLMGAFAGIFVAAPAFVLWQERQFDANKSSFFGHGGSSDSESGMNLGEFLSC